MSRYRCEVLSAIAASKVIGIVRTDTAEQAAAGARALLAGGLTVLDPETARLAILAGARFLVSPGAYPRVAAVAHRYGAAYLPGALTPTEIVSALSDGPNTVSLPLAFTMRASLPGSLVRTGREALTP